MKKSIIPFFIAVFITLVGCEETQSPIYDGGQTFIGFAGTNTTLEVEVASMNTTTVTIDVSTTSSSERTATLSVVDEFTTIAATQYSVPTTVTIPANSYSATLTVTAMDDGNLSSDGSTLRLSLESIDDGGVADNTQFTVNVFRICPVPETFLVGDYTIVQDSPYIDGATFDDGSTVTITADGISRTFETINYPDYSSTLVPFTFSLICNNFIVPLQDNNTPCGSGTDWFGPPVNNVSSGSYSIPNDSSFTLTFGDDLQTDCGAPLNTTYTFTKI